MKYHSPHIKKHESSRISTLYRMISVKSSECTMWIERLMTKNTLFQWKYKNNKRCIYYSINSLVAFPKQTPIHWQPSFLLIQIIVIFYLPWEGNKTRGLIIVITNWSKLWSYLLIFLQYASGKCGMIRLDKLTGILLCFLCHEVDWRNNICTFIAKSYVRI